MKLKYTLVLQGNKHVCRELKDMIMSSEVNYIYHFFKLYNQLFLFLTNFINTYYYF
jgi:hypothetical protein